MRRVIFLMIIFFATATLSAVEFVSAQTKSPSDLILSIHPTHPGPDESVSVTVQNYLIDLSRARIVWRKDGETIASGTGLREVSFNTRRLGETTVIEVSARTEGGSTLVGSARITPGEVDLLWEANSSAPPFYKGRRLPGKGVDITVAALPNMRLGSGNTIPPSELFFLWEINGAPAGDLSGKGKSMLRFSGDVLASQVKIGVLVSNNTETLFAKKEIVIRFAEPEIVLYPFQELSGALYGNSIDTNEDLSGERAGILAESYWFPQNTIPLVFSWIVNGVPISEKGSFPNVLFLSRPTQESVLRVEVEGKTQEGFFAPVRSIFTGKL